MTTRRLRLAAARPPPPPKATRSNPFPGFTPAGLDQLARILRRAIALAKVKP